MAIATPVPLVTLVALKAFTQQLVERFAPDKVILFGSQARGEGRWDSDADILVVMPFQGRHLAQIRAIRKSCPVSFPLDLLVRSDQPFTAEVRDQLRALASAAGARAGITSSVGFRAAPPGFVERAEKLQRTTALRSRGVIV
jgi:predicted nucleotidyltransferase